MNPGSASAASSPSAASADNATPTPSVTVLIPAALRPSCSGASELSIPSNSVRSLLSELERRHPALYRSVCDETGAIRRHVNLFVNSQHMRDCNGLDTSLNPRDVVTILPAVSGG